MKALIKKFDRFLEICWMKMFQIARAPNFVARDMVYVLLQLAGVAADPNLEVKLERHGVKAFSQDLLAGGTESSAMTVEWGMSELLRKPEIMKKAIEELDRVIGRERWVEENGISDNLGGPNVSTPRWTMTMLQCLEWEPSGSFYQPNVGRNSQNGAPGSGRINYSQDISDPTLPHNPRKAVLYRPSVTHFLAVLATVCEELPSDGVILIYLSASGSGMYSDASSLPSDKLNSSFGQSKGDDSSLHTNCLHFGSHGNGGINSIFPSDLVPFTRKPLFLVIDGDSSEAFEAINGVQKGETAAMLLSSSSSFQATDVGSSRQPSGSLFTIFLTAPMQAFCLLIGISGPDIDMDIYNNAEKLLSSSLSDWGSTLATSDTIDAVWAQVLTDPFLRRLILRFIFCRAVLSLYAPTFNKKEFIPKCVPCLPASFLPTTAACQTVILQIANIFGASTKFIFSEGLVLPENRQGDTESVPC